MFIKISVAVALLRIAATRPVFKWVLWALIGATTIAALVFCIGIANICESADIIISVDSLLIGTRSPYQHTMGRVEWNL